MRRFAFALLFLAMVTAMVTVAFGQGIEAIPAWAKMEQYPPMGRPLSGVEQATFGLHPVLLSSPWTGLNWYEARRRLVLETLPVGTLVLADLKGAPIYKASCGNRLVALVPPAAPQSQQAHLAVDLVHRQPPSILERLGSAGARWGWKLAAGAIALPFALALLLGGFVLTPILILFLLLLLVVRVGRFLFSLL